MDLKKALLTHVFPGLKGANLATLLQVWLGSALTLGTIALLDRTFGSPMGLPLIIAPFGASAVLVFGAPMSPLARPRNVIGGHTLSALVGVFFAHTFTTDVALAAACAVATAIVLMILTGTLHPPGGATALIAVIGGPSIEHLGYLYVFVPCFSGSLVVMTFAVLFNAAGLRCRLIGALVSRDHSMIKKPRLLKRCLHLLCRLHRQ